MDDFWAAHKFAAPWQVSGMLADLRAEIHHSEVATRGLHGHGRFAAEHWVHSAPSTQMCDLYAGHYVWDYMYDAAMITGTWSPQLQMGIRWPLWRYTNGELLLNSRNLKRWVQWRCLEWRAVYKKLPSNFSTWRFEESLQKLAGVSLETVDSCNPALFSPGDE